MRRINPNTPSLKSWLSVDKNSDFPIQNIPFGIISTGDDKKRAASRIGDHIIDLAALHEMGYFGGLDVPKEALNSDTLNDFIRCGKIATKAIRARLAHLFQAGDPENIASRRRRYLYEVEQVDVHLPVAVGDYTDFYSSEDHARNVGTMFRDPDNALLPNWKHIPVGYHGRASSIIVSGTEVRRPKGQILPNDSDTPVYDACKLLDFELEMAFIVGKDNQLGSPVTTAEAEDYIFGLVLFNDWSARDIQKWEYIPLGPFLSKSFASTISPWIVTLEALNPFRVQAGAQDPPVLPYLEYSGAKNYDVNLDVFIQPENGAEHQVSRSNFKYMYWNMTQQLAHHTVNGCNMKVGDMCGSGTISGPDPSSYGSMLELSWRGTKPINMPDGSIRKFIADGDTVIMRGFAEKDGVRIGFGDCSGKILPALTS